MTSIIDIERYLERSHFVEVLYFGTLALASCPTVELHAGLGVACCATIKSLAQTQRLMRGVAVTTPCLYGGPDRHTLLVNEGVQHLLRALRMDVHYRFPAALEPVIREVIDDLLWFVKEEFHDVTSHQGRGYHPRQAALYARVLLAYLQRQDDTFAWKGMSGVENADNLLAELLSSSSETAAFSTVLGDGKAKDYHS